MTRSVAVLTTTLALLGALALSACGRSETIDGFKPDRAEEKVAVTDKGAAPATAPAATPVAAGGILAPQDECVKDTAFVAYRGKLAAAVKAKSFDQLKPLLNSAIKLDFGGGAGLENFAARLAKAPNGDVGGRPQWDELAEILTLGCALGSDGTSASMPYAFERIGDRDAFQTMFPRRSGITLFKSNDGKSDAVRTLGWDVLTITAPADGKAEYVAVKLDDGTAGFVRRADARSAVDYRALFNKDESGNWLMTAFVAGD